MTRAKLLAALVSALAAVSARAEGPAAEPARAEPAREALRETAVPMAPVAPVYARLQPVAALRVEHGALAAYGPIAATTALGLEALPVIPALSAAAALGLEALPVIPALSAACGVQSQIPEMAPLTVRAGRLAGTLTAAYAALPGVAAIEPGRLPGYGPLRETGAVAHDPFLTLHDLWRQGPLGMLRDEALRANEAGEQERYAELSRRFWEWYRIAIERRAVFGNRE